MPWGYSRTKRRGSNSGAIPRYVEKLRDIVGLYLNPPVCALVLRVDEKT